MSGAIRVLHVDEDDGFAAAAGSLLADAEPRLEVSRVAGAAAALDRLETGEFDCVVSEYAVPGTDGVEFVATVRERWPGLPVVVFTAAGRDAAADAVDAGATGYQQKHGGEAGYRLLAERVADAVGRVRAERRADELARTNGMLRAIHRGLVRARSRADVEETVCSVLADADPYALVCIAHVADGVVTPSTSAGADGGYLSSATITTDPDDPRGQGPAGRAVRTGDIQVTNDVLTDPTFEPWREQAAERGFRSVAAVPLSYEGTVHGVMGVYADRPGTFDGRERELLSELGGDIARAMRMIDLRADIRRFETVIQALGDPVYALDEEGRYTFVNDAFLEQTGYDRGEVIGEHVSLVIPESEVERGREVIGDLLESGDDRATYETERVTADGDRLLTENHLALLRDDDGGFLGSAGVQRDITDRKRSERELRRQNERLDRLAGLISHELRNPISVAEGYVDVLQAECDSDHLDSVSDALDRTDEMLDNLYVMARDVGEIGETAPVDLSAFGPRCWANVVTGEATLDAAGAPTVRADEAQLSHALENLFENAVEHGGGTVTVGELADGSGFYVADDGEGIPEDQRERMFGEGYSSGGGMGLGLAVVAEVAEAHGWSVTAAGSASGGARFEFRNVEVVG